MYCIHMSTNLLLCEFLLLHQYMLCLEKRNHTREQEQDLGYNCSGGADCGFILTLVFGAANAMPDNVPGMICINFPLVGDIS